MNSLNFVLMKKNLFIVLEGLDGSGKSTQVKLLSEKLEREGHQVYSTFEPTDSPTGKLIRDIFNHRAEADHRTIAALFVADRLEHLLNKKNGLLSKLKEGFTVISDRYYFSSYAYHGTHMDVKSVIAMNAMCADLLRPDLNIYIDLYPELCIDRLNKNRSSKELYETLDNLRIVRKKYLEAFDLLKGKEKIFITDGNQTPEMILAEVWKEVYELLKIHD